MKFEEFFEIYFMTALPKGEYGGVEIRALRKFGKKNVSKSLYVEKDHILVPENRNELFEIIKEILYLNRKKQWNIYYSANPRKPPFDCVKTKYGLKCKAGDKRKVIDYVRILMLDFDILHKESITDVAQFELWLKQKSNREALFNAIAQVAYQTAQLLEKHGLVPTIITYSGYGFQLVFALDRPIPKGEYDYYAQALLDMVEEILSKEPIDFDPVHAQIPSNIAKKTRVLPDEQVKDVARILRLPNSYNWRYSVPVMADVIYPKNPDEYKVVTTKTSLFESKVEEIKANEDIMNIKMAERNDFSSENVTMLTKYSWTASVKMGEKAKTALYNFLSKHYVYGQRHNIVLRVAGMARAFGYRPEDVLEIVQKVYNESGDTDNFSDRYQAVVDTYSKPPGTVGWQPLKAIEQNLSKKYPPRKDGKPSKKFLKAMDEARRDVKSLMKAFFEDIEKAEEEGRVDDLVKVNEEGEFVIE